MRDYIYDCPKCGCGDETKIIYTQSHIKDEKDPEYYTYARIGRLTCKKCGFFIQTIEDTISKDLIDCTVIKWNKLYNMLKRERA
jgi:hypothetical protein